MTDGFHHNHYVPEWYQRRFLPPEQVYQKLYYLDLRPEPFIDPMGRPRPKRNPRFQGFKHCFAEDDLYTIKFGGIESTELERRFFGNIDNNGRKAVNHCAQFKHPWDGTDFFRDLLMYMSTQKLRTPKGLSWLSGRAGSLDKDNTLRLMARLQNLHCAIWAECVWLIADATKSETKFIVSDHPVTVYNRKCGPRSQWCRGDNDPDIALHGTHTIFPLSLDKILILTNLSWLRNPYQSETAMRPNPNPIRNTLFKITEIQTLRSLNEDEVRQINFIIKNRAWRYIAAAKEEWLYPEIHVSKSDWHQYGSGYLLMPDPRSVIYGGEILIRFRDGASTTIDEYGRHPWQAGFKGRDEGVGDDFQTFHRFRGEFASMFGPYRRGRAFDLTSLDPERDDEELHEYNISLNERRNKRKVAT